MPSKAKTDRFNKLISKYLKGKATPEEATFMEKYYKYFEHNSDLTNSLSQNEIDEVKQRMLEKLKEEMSRLSDKPATPVRNKWIIRMMAAAAVSLLIIGGTIYLQTQQEKHQATQRNIAATIQHDVAPGGNKAMITLEDGSRIFLDSLANGTISEQGSMQVIKLSNGEIVYRKKDNNSSEIFINTMTTPRGGQYQLTLADGTKVWMNAESSISYPTAFVETERKVKITGEVYFEVAPLSLKKGQGKVPFIVQVNSPSGDNNMEIQVLGTHFNVNTYADNGAVTTTLLEGLIRIKNNKEEQILKPGQQAEASNTIRVKNNVDTDLVMSWKSGYFSFNNTGLQTVMKQLSRWYDVDVTYKGGIPDMKFWGGISMSSNLSEVLKVLEESKVNFRIENKTIIVFPKPK